MSSPTHGSFITAIDVVVARILSIDYGRKRTGLAVTDPLQIIAGGLATVSTYQLLEFLHDYFLKEDVELVVVGEPRQTNGKPSENMGRVKAFVEKFRKQFPNIAVTMYDERFTSTLAHHAMLDAGLKRKARQDKALVDEVSATIILQSFMESRRSCLTASPPQKQN